MTPQIEKWIHRTALLVAIVAAYCSGASIASPPEASVATAHRLAQARTDAQPVLKDDLAGQKRINGGESAGNLPAIPDSSLDLGKVLADHIAANQPQRRKLLVISAPGCGPCVAQDKEWGNQPGKDGVDVEHLVCPDWVLPSWVPAAAQGFPCNVLLDSPGSQGGVVRKCWGGMRPWKEMRGLLAANPAASPQIVPQAVSIGKIQMGQTVSAILDRVSTDRGASVISLGSASVYLPAAMPVTVQLSPQAATLTFSGGKPRARYSLLGADINAITISRDRCTVSLAGMPDLVMEVVVP